MNAVPNTYTMINSCIIDLIQLGQYSVIQHYRRRTVYKYVRVEEKIYIGIDFSFHKIIY